jgi:nucleotide-binding universal stress UspA family protein
MKGPFRKILVATDGSPSSLKAARLAAELAHACEAELIALHVVEEDLLPDLRRFAGKSAREARELLSEEGRKYLRDVEKIAQEQWVKAVPELGSGIPHEVLLDLVAKKRVDLVVMGTVGRRGPRRRLMGSVTQRVIDSSEAAVLVVK